jgi:hypothetical protein
MFRAKNTERPLPRAGYLPLSPGNHAEMIADEHAPSHPHPALELLPIALNDVTIHIDLHCAVVACFSDAGLLRSNWDYRILGTVHSIAPAVETGNCATHSQ